MSQKIIAKIFNYAASEGADHLVIAKRDDDLILDCYFSGAGKQSLVLPQKLEQEIFSSLRKILAIAPGELAAQKYCKLPHKSGHLNFYLTILPDGCGEKIIINLIKRPATLWRLNRLGLQKPDLQTLKKTLNLRSGLILLSSPDGGGKSATLNSLLLELSDSEKSIYYLGGYRAYEIPGIIALDPTPNNLEKILKSDSEIIFIDGLDEHGLTDMAIRAAISGRLIFGTMQAENAFEALGKIMLTTTPLKSKLDSLKMIINQRLIPLKRKPRKDAADQRQEIGLFEILNMTPVLKKSLLEDAAKEPALFRKGLEKAAINDGHRSLAHDRLHKAKDGLI